MEQIVGGGIAGGIVLVALAAFKFASGALNHKKANGGTTNVFTSDDRTVLRDLDRGQTKNLERLDTLVGETKEQTGELKDMSQALRDFTRTFRDNMPR